MIHGKNTLLNVSLVAFLILTIMLGLPLQVYAADEFGDLNNSDFDSTNVPLPGYGFGDDQNAYPWSIEYFKGDIYVGTGRLSSTFNTIYELIMSGIFTSPPYPELPDLDHPPFLADFLDYSTNPPTVTDATAQAEWASVSRGEIWRYRDSAWERVYQANLVEALLQGPDAPYQAPQASGFRYMIAYQDSNDEEEALYAAQGGVSLAKFSQNYLLLKSLDGDTWTPLATPLIPSGGMGRGTRAMAVHNEKLYVGVGSGFVAPAVWCSDDPDAGAGSWSKVLNFPTLDNSNKGIASMISYNDRLYVGTKNDDGFQIWKSTVLDPQDNDDWELIVDQGASDKYNKNAQTMIEFKGHLYVGSLVPPFYVTEESCFKGFDLIRIAEDDSWELIIGPYCPRQPPDVPAGPPISGWPSGFGNPTNFYCWSLEVKEDYMYLGTFDASPFARYALTHLPPEHLEILLGYLNDFKDNLTPEDKESIAEIIAHARERGYLSEKQLELLEKFYISEEEVTADDLQDLIQFFSGADLWKTDDGIVWKPVTLNGFDNINSYGFRTMQYAQGALYVGASNPWQGCEVFKATQPTTLVDPKTATLYIDADHNSLPSPGDTIKYTAEITNVGEVTREDATFSDTVDPQTTLICDEPNQPTTTHGTVTSCDSTLGTLTVDIGNIDPGVTVTITFYVIINQDASGEVANQGITSGSNFPNSPTDDPNARVPDTPTRNSLGSPVGGVVTPVNKLMILSPYLVLVGLLAAVSTAYLIRRRKG
jgi:uncharacterized repeat protein (TIGR01451 family)